jgi:hypothetical protein
MEIDGREQMTMNMNTVKRNSNMMKQNPAIKKTLYNAKMMFQGEEESYDIKTPTNCEEFPKLQC